MVLGFMTKFPWGEPTNFFQKIISGVYNPDNPQASPGNLFRHQFKPKLHTIRAGNRWKEGMTLHMATGVRTKQYNQFNKNIPELQKVKSVQRIDIILRGPDCVMIFVDKTMLFCRCKWRSKHINSIPLQDGFYAYGYVWFWAFLQNDGLTEEQFFKFFKKPLRNGQLIHWTNLKY